MLDFYKFELRPIDSRKSFYGKAVVQMWDNVLILDSYETTICAWDNTTSTFIRHWNGYSATTMRHVNSFMRFIGTNLGGKAWWDKLECGKVYTLSELLNL